MTIHFPQLTFFSELSAQNLQTLFRQPDVIASLQTLQAAVSLGILDLSPERAEVVRSLNQAGIPVTAWLLLPREQGYWFNLDNDLFAVRRYHEFKEWTAQNDLHWACIGLDIEPDIQAMQMLSSQPTLGARLLLRHAFNGARLKNGAKTYHELIQQIHADGYPVETYQFPFILDERQAQSHLIQRLIGVVDLPEADQEVLMLYSTFYRPWGPAVLWNYAPQARGIGIGSTGGGVEFNGSMDVSPLSWDEFQTDLLLSAQHSPRIYVFSLEGCVQQGFLSRLTSFDWQQPVHIPYDNSRKVQRLRQAIGKILWLSARPAWLLLAVALFIGLISRLPRKKRA